MEHEKRGKPPKTPDADLPSSINRETQENAVPGRLRPELKVQHMKDKYENYGMFISGMEAPEEKVDDSTSHRRLLPSIGDEEPLSPRIEMENFPHLERKASYNTKGGRKRIHSIYLELKEDNASDPGNKSLDDSFHSQRNNSELKFEPGKSSVKEDNAQKVNPIVIEVLIYPEINRHVCNDQTLSILSAIKLRGTKGFQGLSLKNVSFKDVAHLDNEIPDVPIKVHTMGELQLPLQRRRSIGDEIKLKEKTPGKNLKNPSKSDRLTPKQKKELMNSLSNKLNKLEVSNSFSISIGDLKERLSKYVQIALFLSLELGIAELGRKLLFYDYSTMKLDGVTELSKIMESQSFIEKLLENILLFDEKKTYDLLMSNIKNWEEFFTEKIVDIHMKSPRADYYLLRFLENFNRYLIEKHDAFKRNPKGKRSLNLYNKESPDKSFNLATRSVSLENSNLIKINQEKMILIINKYFERIESNDLILDILKNLNYTSKEVVELLLCVNEENRLISFFSDHKTLVQYLDPKNIVDKKLYKLLIVFDKIELIKVFHIPIGSKRLKSSTIFHELCSSVKSGVKIQALCFLMLNVESTFWDFDKLWRFYRSINKVIRNDSNRNWIAYVDSPLLFFAKLVHFFQSTDQNLSIGSKEIEKLCTDLITLCVHYIDICSDETLVINIFDKDPFGLTFLDYSFLIKRKEIIELRFIEKVINNMWDLGRDSKQSLGDHFRLNIFGKDSAEFEFKSFTKDYMIPVEETDTFQLEFYQTSRSAYLSVVSDILWTLSIIGMEFAFSLLMIHNYQSQLHPIVDFSNHFLTTFYNQHPEFTIILVIVRISYLISFILRYLSLGYDKRMGNYIRHFYAIMLILNFGQLILYLSHYSIEFWLLNNLQMLVVLTLILYAFYLGLSLNTTGIIFRIFTRMVAVVVVFGLASLVIITVIAYPIHTMFINFDQVVEGQVFPQMNMFKSLYNGVLTLFEFVFGAVVFVRPYQEQNFYTYSITLIMVIFSFFGNIMLANMLVAFLTSQFANITNNAKYHTLKMQFGLTKILRRSGLDSIYSIPYVFHVIFFPAYLFMISNSTKREKINRFLRKVVHIVNVFIPWLVFYTLYLLWIIIIRYLQTIGKICGQLTKSISYVFHLVGWIVLGVPFLLRLFIYDLIMIIKRILDFRDSEESELYMINLGESQRRELLKIFENIYEVATTLKNERKLNFISLPDMLFEISRVHSRKKKKEEETDNQSESSSEEDDTNKVPNSIFNRNKYHFEKKYNTTSLSIYNIILSRFSEVDDNCEIGQNREEIDLNFLIDKFKPNLKIERIHYLVGFEKAKLEDARNEIIKEEAEVIGEIAQLNSRMELMNKDIQSLAKLMIKLDSKFSKFAGGGSNQPVPSE